MAELSYMIYLVLIQNIVMFIMHFVTFLLLSHTLYTKIKMLGHAEISSLFLVYLFSINIMAFFGLINSGYVITVWWQGTNNAFVIYTTTAAVLMTLPIVSLAVFFLIIHRILIITRFMARTNIQQWLFVLTIVSMLGLMGFTTAYYIWTWNLIMLPAPINCWSVNCITRFNGSVFSVWAKLVTGFLNSIVGSCFFYVLKKSQKEINLSQQPREQANRKKANNLAMFTIILEIILNFIPAFIDLILRSTINLSLTQYVGVYTMFFGAADGTFVAILYSKSFGKIKSIKVSAISSIILAVPKVSRLKINTQK